MHQQISCVMNPLVDRDRTAASYNIKMLLNYLLKSMIICVLLLYFLPVLLLVMLLHYQYRIQVLSPPLHYINTPMCLV